MHTWPAHDNATRKTQPADDALTYYPSLHSPIIRGPSYHPFTRPTHNIAIHASTLQLLHASAHPFTPLLILRRRGTWSKVPSSRYVTCVTPPASVVPVTQSFLRLRPDRSWSSKIYDNYTVPNRSGCRSLQQSNRTGKNCCDVRSALGMPRDVAEAIVPRRHGSLLAPAA